MSPAHLTPEARARLLAGDWPLSLAHLDSEAVAALLVRLQPGQYAEPPPPDVPTRALRREALARVYARRHRAGRHLYHPADLIQCRAADKLATLARTLANGLAQQSDVSEG